MARRSYRPNRGTFAAKGAFYGARAARENIDKHGCTLAENNLRDLKIAARRGDAFDKAYARAYAEVVASCRRGGR